MPKILFVLPVRGGSGGAHSVMQEATALLDLGIEVSIAVNAVNAESLRRAYDRFDWVREGGLVSFEGPRELAPLAARADVTIATTNTSTHSLAEALAELRGGAPRTAYYVQDYEPLFYDAGSARAVQRCGGFGW